MQTSFKALCISALAAAGFFAAVPALAQIYNPGYAYPQFTQPVSQPYYGYGCPALSYNLTLGSSDYYTQGQVSALQNFLRNRYNDSRLTGGYFGSLTRSYVARFQQEMGVYPVTGGVGPLTRAAIARTCGGGYYPNPNPTPSATTFRLDRNFTLNEGQTGRLSNGELEITVNDIDTRDDEVAVTLGLACRAGTQCFYYPHQSYTLEEDDTVTFQGFEVELVSFTSSRATFHVIDEDDNNNDDDASIEVSRPTSSDDVEQGDTQRVVWSSSDEPSSASVILDLYTSGGSKVGTIAVSDDTDGSYSWHVPERNTYCTLQYPNGLCGYDLDGSYYIKASLVRGNGFNGGEVLDTDTSGTFDIDR